MKKLFENVGGNKFKLTTEGESTPFIIPPGTPRQVVEVANQIYQTVASAGIQDMKNWVRIEREEDTDNIWSINKPDDNNEEMAEFKLFYLETDNTWHISWLHDDGEESVEPLDQNGLEQAVDGWVQ